MHERTSPDDVGGDEVASLRASVETMLDHQWVEAGYAAPNEHVYPWQWLWDSCFHVVTWAELGRPERAVAELTQVLRNQDALGFVPHMNYQLDPDAHADLWGRRGSSSITQPPMFGHAVAELVRRGIEVSDEVVDRSVLGVRFLLDQRPRHDSGLVRLCHPWESGADDSPRWDDLCPGGFDRDRWRDRKNELVGTIVRSEIGSPMTNPGFDVASVGFSALVAFNALELASIGADDLLGVAGRSLAEVITGRWDSTRSTWCDAGDTSQGSGRARTLDGLLPLLVVDDPEQLGGAFDSLLDPEAHGARFGPLGVHRAEPTFEPRTYWRGPAWPQLTYLLWVAARRHGRAATASTLARSMIGGAIRSGLAEYWDGDDGTGLGARPQSWAGLAVTMGA